MRQAFIVHKGELKAVNVVSMSTTVVMVERSEATGGKAKFVPSEFAEKFAESPVMAVQKAIEKRRSQIRWHGEQSDKIRAEIVALNKFAATL